MDRRERRERGEGPSRPQRSLRSPRWIHQRLLAAGERVDWGFAVNGVTSVLGSAAVLLVAMSAGFRVALVAAAALYASAWAVLAWRGAWSLTAGEPGEEPAAAPEGRPGRAGA